jgi:hypothetical protein
MDNPHARMLLDAQCNIGAGEPGRECIPGGRECWQRHVTVVESRDQGPACYVVDPAGPFSNKRAGRRLIRDARGVIRWYERDMPAKVLELIADEIADTGATRICLLSGDLDYAGRRQRARAARDLADFRTEYASSGVGIEWRELRSGEIPHDRLFLSDDVSLNVPPVNTLLKGDASEISESGFTKEWFDELWEKATPVC